MFAAQPIRWGQEMQAGQAPSCFAAILADRCLGIIPIANPGPAFNIYVSRPEVSLGRYGGGLPSWSGDNLTRGKDPSPNDQYLAQQERASYNPFLFYKYFPVFSRLFRFKLSMGVHILFK